MEIAKLSSQASSHRDPGLRENYTDSDDYPIGQGLLSAACLSQSSRGSKE